MSLLALNSTTEPVMPMERAETVPRPNAEAVRTGPGLLICGQVFVAVGAATWIVWDGLSDLCQLGWNEAESSHVLLVPFVFAWTALVRRHRIRECTFQGRWTGVMLIAIGWALWAQGYRYQVQTFWHLGAVLLVAGSAITFLGRDVFWKFLPAWLTLLFLVPLSGRVRQFIAIPMEQITAVMTQSVAEVLGIDCGRSGNQLSVNGVAVGIVEACNGLRMIVTLFLACYVFAFTRPLRWWVRLIIVGASPAVAVVCNVIRLVPTVWMFGHASNSAAERFHDLAGWGMLLVAFGLLTGIIKLLDWVGLSIYDPSGSIRIPNSPAAAKGR